ncbi:MAG: MoaD/ThiS family protein [Desulfobacteraceae bacterium]|nr:MoaD/ThiS family protein [Desulfobacteraceae bacterium]
MPVKLMLAANLRKYVSGYSGETGYAVQVEPGSTVRDLAGLLKIPEQEVKLIMIDGVGAQWDNVLKGDERVALFPPVGGG